jgi:hypothetical protein
VERERDERLKAGGFVLQGLCPQHVIDAFFRRLDVPVQHGHVRAKAEAVSDAMDVQIALGAALVVCDLLSHTVGENLGATTRQRIKAGRHQLAQHLLVAHAVQVGEERNSTAVKHFKWMPGRIRLKRAAAPCSNRTAGRGAAR